MRDLNGPEAPPASARPRDGIARPAYLVAVGGLLVVLVLPLVGAFSRLLGGGLVLAGVLVLLRRTVQPQARRRMQAAAALAAVVVATMLLLLPPELFPPSHGMQPAWVGWAAITQMALGISGTAILAAGLAREVRHRGRLAAETAWWQVALAVGLIQGPILVAATLSQIMGRPDGVGGPVAIALFLAAIVPYLLIARAGHLSNHEIDTPETGRAEAGSR
jgi:MFS family permease